MDEIWKPIIGYEGLYEVSNLGRVRSLDRFVYKNNAHNPILIIGKIMNTVVSHRGYRMVGLRPLEGKRKNCSVHRLVAKAFIPNPDNLPFVNHKDYNKLNNCVTNLEWCTPHHNVHYGRADEIRQLHQPWNVPVKQYTKDGVYIRDFVNMSSAAREVGSTRQLIRDCCKGILHSAGGYVWKYA